MEHPLVPTLDEAFTAPIPIIGRSRRVRDSFLSLSHRNFRQFQSAQVVLHTAAWMFRIAVDWLALEITGEIAAVGLLVFIQWAPIIVLGQYGAMIADRFPRRITVAVSYAILGLLSALLAALAFAGVVELWHIVLIAFGIGLVGTVEIPARTVLVSEMVSVSNLQNAISLYAIVFWLGAVIGPVIAGFTIASAGTAWSILAYPIACAGMSVTVAALRLRELRVVAPKPLVRPEFTATLRYARSKPTIFWPMILVGFFATFALPMGVLLSGMAKVVYQSGPAGFGLYSSMLAIGALMGAILSTRVRALRLRTLVLAAGLFAVLQLTAGLVGPAILFLPVLIGVGCARLVYDVLSSTLVQLSCNPGMRGRIVSLYVSVHAGGQAFGGLILGVLSGALGPQAALVLSGGIPLAAAIVIGVTVARRSSLTLTVRRTKRFAMLSVVTRQPD
jgi:MFS family permease